MTNLQAKYAQFQVMKREAVQTSAWLQVERAFEAWMASLSVADQFKAQS